METSQSLTFDSAFWSDTESNSVLLNPRLPAVDQLRSDLESAARRAGLKGQVIFSTSGTTGRPKFAALSRNALLTSAAAVNAHLNANEMDHWFLALPAFHVGGLGIHARAHLLEGRFSAMSGRWDADHFVAELSRASATLTALVPTQLHDIVTRKLKCPPSLRVVLVGGGALAEPTRKAARASGWPVVTTFGMTEAASQIATQPVELDVRKPAGMSVLPIWNCRVNERQLLEIKGLALFSGYLQRESASRPFAFACATNSDGWFTTSDRVSLTPDGEGCLLTPLSRADQMIKILGENIDLAAIQQAIDPSGLEIVIGAIPDARNAHQLVAVSESKTASELTDIDRRLARHNVSASPPERIKLAAILPIIPRTELGKVAKDQFISELLHLDNFRNIK